MTIVSPTTPPTSPAPVAPAARKATDRASSGTPLIEMQHLADPLDRTLMRLAAEHGDKVSTLADYPEFAAQFAASKEADCG